MELWIVFVVFFFSGEKLLIWVKGRVKDNRRWLGRNKRKEKKEIENILCNGWKYMGMKTEQGAISAFNKREASSRMFLRRENHKFYLHLIPIFLNLKRPFPFEVFILVVVSEQGCDCVMTTIQHTRWRIFKWSCVRLEIFFGRITGYGANMNIK